MLTSMVATIGFAGAAIPRAGLLTGLKVAGPSGANETTVTGNVTAPPAGEGELAPGQRVEQTGSATAPKGADGEPLSHEEQARVKELKRRDAEVRAHEQAHAAAGGPYAGPPNYQYVVGPDGKRYAVGGEVAIDASPVRGDPQATIRKLDVVIRAALAPADPSAQDLQVARDAQLARAQAQAELTAQRQAEHDGEDDTGSIGNVQSSQADGQRPDPRRADVLEAARAYAQGHERDEELFASFGAHADSRLNIVA